MVELIASNTIKGKKISTFAREGLNFSVSRSGLEAHIKTEVAIKWCQKGFDKIIKETDDKLKYKAFEKIRVLFKSEKPKDDEDKNVVTGENLVLMTQLSYKLLTL